MACYWLKFYQFLVLYIEKKAFLEFLCYGTQQVGFQGRVILDLWGMVFHAMDAFCLEVDFLLDSISACCDKNGKKIFYIKCR